MFIKAKAKTASQSGTGQGTRQHVFWPCTQQLLVVHLGMVRVLNALTVWKLEADK